MKQFTHPELPFPIVNSFKKMSAYHQKSVTLFGCLATVSVSKSFFGAVTVEFEFDDATQSTVDTLRDTVLSLFGEPTHVGGSRFFFQKAGVVLSHGIIEKYYNSINHIFTVSFARLPALVWPFWRYQLYLYTLQAEWEPFSLVMKSLHAPDFANRRLSIILENENRSYLLAIRKTSFQFYAQKKTKSEKATRLSPIGHRKGGYPTLNALAKQLRAFLDETKPVDS